MTLKAGPGADAAYVMISSVPASGALKIAATCIDRSNWCGEWKDTACTVGAGAVKGGVVTIGTDGPKLQVYDSGLLAFESLNGECVGIDESTPTAAELVEVVEGGRLVFGKEGRIYQDSSGKLWIQAGLLLDSAGVALSPSTWKSNPDWHLLLRQTAPTVASDADWSCANPSSAMCLASPSDPNYSAMGQLTESGQALATNIGKFHFKLVWNSGEVQEWKQSSNPMTYKPNGDDGAGGVLGYEEVAVHTNGCHWRGLEWSGSNALLDGSVTKGSYWFALGTHALFDAGLPGPCGGPASSSVVLYAKNQEPASPSAWHLLLRQTAPTVASDADWSCANPSSAMCLASPSDPNYSAMGQLTESGQALATNIGKFHFKLVWNSGEVQEWKQSSNPMTYKPNGDDGAGGVLGYEEVAVHTNGCHWRGLEWSGSNALLDGSVTKGSYWFALGTHALFDAGLPGPCGGPASSSVELWVML